MTPYEVLQKLKLFIDPKTKDISLIEINNFITQFENEFIKPDFYIENDLVESFLTFNHVITNLFYICNKTTDNLIRKLSSNDEKIRPLDVQSAIKILSIFSGFNTITLDYEFLFEKYNFLTSYWYFQILNNRVFTNNNYVLKIKEHLENIKYLKDPIAFSKASISSYFSITYLSPEHEKILKEKINSFAKTIFSNQKYKSTKFDKPNNSNKKKIAIISNFLYGNHAINRCFFNYIKDLSINHDLTLICSGDIQKVDISIFKSIINIDLSSDGKLLSKLVNNDFDIVFFPEVGMSIESIILSNIRIAPIQIAGYGHPVSTWGSEIDYFLIGSDVENIEKANENYYEKLIVIPKRGVISYIPEKVESEKNKSDNLIIGLPHTIQKLNYEFVNTLKIILSKSNKKIIFRFFPSTRNTIEKMLLKKDLNTILGEDNIEIIDSTNTNEYLKLISECSLIIDSFHFGGHNTVLDGLSQGVPVLVLEGEKAYNKFGSSLLRDCNLDSLICKRVNELIIKAIKLINNNSVLDKVTEQIKSIDLHDLLKEDKESFLFVFENISNQEKKRNIVIEKIKSKINNEVILICNIEGQRSIKNEINKLFYQGKFLELSNLFLDLLLFFGYKNENYKLPEAKEFLVSFLDIFIKKEFVISKELYELFIVENMTIYLLNKIILNENTDKYLKEIISQEPYNNNLDNHLTKVLTLYSIQNDINIDIKSFFKTNSYLSSVWYWRVFYNKNYSSEKNLNFIKSHIDLISEIDGQLDFIDRIVHAYFISTYVSDKDNILKNKINKLIQNNFKNIHFSNTPNKRKIAVASYFWYKEHSVYRVLYPFIEYLSKFYDLTFIKLGNSRFSDDNNIFSDIKNINYTNRFLNISEINENDFCAIIYPDIGMSMESVILSNLRIAPVQIACYGHPVSTFGSEIDYFFVGEDTEDLQNLQNNYSERTVVLPFNSLKPLNIQNINIENNKLNSDFFIISCLASTQKLNNDFILVLKKIIESSKKKILIRFFCTEKFNIVVEDLRIDLNNILGKDNIEVYGALDYKSYLEICSQSDIVIDSYPFGGFNTFIDSLYLKKPFLVIESDKAYGKFASSALKRFGLDELVCKRSNELIVKVLKLVNNEKYLNNIRQKIEKCPTNLIFGRSDELLFKEAIDYILNSKKLNNSNEPIRLSEYFLIDNEGLLKKFEYYLNTKNLLDDKNNYEEIKDFFISFLDNFIKDDFIILENEINSFLNLSPSIGYLAKIFDIKNTDKYIEKIIDVYNPKIKNITHLTKNLTLYSFNNKINFDYKVFFDFEKTISSYWYWECFAFTSYNSELVKNRIEHHLESFNFIENYLLGQIDVSKFAYFYITYSYPKKERIIKEKINSLIKKSFNNNNLIHNTNKRKIGIVSEFLRPRHAVRRSLYKFIEYLANEYDLYLINIGNLDFIPDNKVFKDTYIVKYKDKKLNINDFPRDLNVIYYPDIGMNAESILLSNIRLAPIQIAGYGHPVSTFGSEIDYFIGGEKVEDKNKANENYSETLVLLNGMGVTPEYPLYDNTLNTNLNEFIIACPWTIQKINYQHLLTLKEIISNVDKKVKLRFFIGIQKTPLYYYSKLEIEEVFDSCEVEVIGATNYDDYMKKISECSISLEPFHFGGYNIVVDSIFLRKPVITFSGEKGYNNFASYLLKKLNLDDLVSNSKEEFINNSIKLISDDIYRAKITDKIKKINLEDELFNKNELDNFNNAFKYIIEKHNDIKQSNSSYIIPQ